MMKKSVSLLMSICLLLTLAFPALAIAPEDGSSTHAASASGNPAAAAEGTPSFPAPATGTPETTPEASAPGEELAAGQAFLRVKGFNGTHIKVSTLDGKVLAEAEGSREATATLVPNQPYLVRWTTPDGVGYQIMFLAAGYITTSTLSWRIYGNSTVAGVTAPRKIPLWTD